MQDFAPTLVSPAIRRVGWLLAIVVLPTITALSILHLWSWNLAIPLTYGARGADEIWQLVSTKTLVETGWVLTNPYLGAPDISQWYNNSGAQTSAIHSVIMLALSKIVPNPIRTQQIYFLANFPLITGASYLTCRALGSARLPAFVAGFLFSFLSYRIHAFFFAFLANYFFVPLSTLPAIWILTGRLEPTAGRDRRDSAAGGIRAMLGRKEFLLSVPIVVVTGISDGYYAFFALLLIGFSTFVRAVAGDLRRPANLIGPVVLIAVMFMTVLSLAYPIQQFRKAHPLEANQDLMKQVTDAEVYSPSLKLLLAPIPDHRLVALRDLGRWMIDTSNFNRKFPYTAGAPAPLGTLGSALLLGALLVLAMRCVRSGRTDLAWADDRPGTIRHGDTIGAIALLCLFVLLCSIGGGIGSLIALIYPAIRAYERFPIFLIFLLFLGAALLVTPLFDRRRTRWLAGALTIVVCLAALFDQVPRDILSLGSPGGVIARRDPFLAERAFVRRLEASLPPGAMVYQYPYSQYLSNSRYYGWGAFGHLRLYLHSRALKWSNGGAKGSPSDNWHERQSYLPVDRLVTEMRAVGFRAIVVDRKVVPAEEYSRVKATLDAKFGPANEDIGADLTSWSFDDVGYRLDYDPGYEQPRRLTLDRAVQRDGELPRLVDADALAGLLGQSHEPFPLVLTRDAHPEIFRDGQSAKLGMGQAMITRVQDIRGGLACSSPRQDPDASAGPAVALTVDNRSSFDWKLGGGDHPLRIGAQLRKADGAPIRDIPIFVDPYVERGQSLPLRIPLSALALSEDELTQGATVQFALLQEGNTWFTQPGHEVCRVSVSDLTASRR